MGGLGEGSGICPGVVPVLVGPLQVLLTILPGLLVALAGGLIGLFKPSGLKNVLLLLWRQKVAVACLIALAGGLYVGAKHFWPRASRPVTQVQEGSDWPTARLDAQRTGAVPGSPSPTRPALVWSFRDGDEGFLSSPAVVGNRLYIASAQLGAFSKSGKIYCLDADTGAVVWSSAPPEYRPTFSSPVIAGDYLVCGEGLHDTRDARIICLDARDGKVLWTFRTNNHVECTPVVADGRVYVGAGDDGYYCLDLKPGADGQATLHWHLPAEKYPDAETSLAVHEGKVYAGLGNNGAQLVVLDAVSGAELQRLKMPYPVFSPAAIADGKLYLGMGNGNYNVLGDGGAVRCLDLKTLNTLWSFALPRTVLGAVAVRDDKIYVGCGDEHLYCLSVEGKLIKKFHALAPIKTSPAVTDSHVYVVSDGGLLFALDRHTLEPAWDFRLGTRGIFFSSPVVARGHLYVGTQSDGVAPVDGLLCLGKPASTKQTPRWGAPLGGPGVAGNSDRSLIPDEGALHWIYGEGRAESRPRSPPIAVWDDALFVGRHDAVKGVQCMPLENENREAPKPRWSAVTKHGVWRSPVVLGQVVACVDGGEHTPQRNLYFIERHSGAVRRTRDLAPGASGVLTVTSQQILVQDAPGHLSSFDDEGEPQWIAAVGNIAHPPAANENLVLVVAQEPAQAVALDRATGEELWRVPLPRAASATPILEKKAFLLATSAGLQTHSLIDGQALATPLAELGTPSGELAIVGSMVVFVNTKGELVAFDRAENKVIARVAGAAPEQTPLVSRGKALYAAPGRLVTLSLDPDATPELWLSFEDLAKIANLPADRLETSPTFVLRESRLFTAWPGVGLVCLGRPK
jgi:outer membrane protein assembly factor BamB